MTAKEMEVAYCKARRTCMKSFRRWLREHISIIEDMKTLGLNDEQVNKITLASMKKAEKEFSDELKAEPELISEIEEMAKPADSALSEDVTVVGN